MRIRKIMKCKACDKFLNDSESVRKDEHGEYPDLCDGCFTLIEDLISFNNDVFMDEQSDHQNNYSQE